MFVVYRLHQVLLSSDLACRSSQRLINLPWLHFDALNERRAVKHIVYKVVAPIVVDLIVTFADLCLNQDYLVSISELFIGPKKVLSYACWHLAF